MSTRSHVTTHVLDAVTGRPASGMRVRLEHLAESDWENIGHGTTDADGRIEAFGPERLPPGTYRAVFATGEHFARSGQPTLYPLVVIMFTLDDPASHYHVPLLLSPYAYSTYRGS